MLFFYRWLLTFSSHTCTYSTQSNTTTLFSTTILLSASYITCMSLQVTLLSLYPHHPLHLSKVKKKQHKDPNHSPPYHHHHPVLTSSLYLHTHEKADLSMPLLMAGTLFISPANLSSFSFRNEGTRGWEESAKSIKYVEEDGQRSDRIKRGRRGGNEEGQKVPGDRVQTKLVRKCEEKRKEGMGALLACLWALQRDGTFNMCDRI